jgi:hypothetical protein
MLASHAWDKAYAASPPRQPEALAKVEQLAVVTPTGLSLLACPKDGS